MPPSENEPAGENPTGEDTSGLGVHWHPGHYLDVGKLDSKLMTRIAKLSESDYKNFQGVQVTFYWGELQQGRDQYSFTELENIVKKLKQINKRLVLRIEDRSFKQGCTNNNLVPSFVGTVNTTNSSNLMCVAKIWETSNMTHLINLIKAIYDKFKNESTFEAIMTQETALPTSDSLTNSGYTRQAHFREVKRLIIEGQAYSKNIHVMQMVNFLNGGKGTDYPGDLAAAAADAGAAISNPDTHPTTNSKGAEHDIPVYDAYERLKGELIVAPNFNTSDLDDQLSIALMQRVYLRAVEQFGAHYVFWNSHGSSKFHGNYSGNFVQDIVLPVINNTSLPKLSTRCPPKVISMRGPCD